MSVASDLFSRLGPEYQQGDQVLQVIFGAIDPEMQTAIDAIGVLHTYFDPATAPDEWLDFLLDRIGWPLDTAYSNYVKREVLKKVGTWRKDYGRTGVIEEIVATYFKTTSTTNSLQIQVNIRGETTGGFRIGRGRIGRGRLWEHFSRSILRVHILDLGDYSYSSNLKAQIEAVLETLIPLWMTYEVVDPA